jgi:predicted Zn-dependent peptidase
MVAAVSKADLIRAYEHLIQHSSLHIYYSGSKTNQEMLSYLYDVPSYHSGEAPLLHPYIDTPVNSQPIYLSEVAEDAEQSHVVVSYRIPIAKYTGMKASVFSVHNSILGYFPTSKLYQEVREKSGLCYSCTLITNNLYGVFMVEAGVQPGREQEAVDRICVQFDAMKKGDFSEEAFHIALESISTASRSLSTSPTQLENHYFAAMLSGNTYRPGLIRAASKQVTHDDVRDAAALLEYVGAFVLTGGEHDN